MHQSNILNHTVDYKYTHKLKWAQSPLFSFTQSKGKNIMEDQMYIITETEDTNFKMIGTMEKLREFWFDTLHPVEHDEANKWVPYLSPIERYSEQDFLMNTMTGEVDTRSNWECDFKAAIEKYFKPGENFIFTHFFDNKDNIKEFYTILEYDSESKYREMIRINNAKTVFLAVQVNLKTDEVRWQIKIENGYVSTNEVLENNSIAINNYDVIKKWLKNNFEKITQTISAGDNDLINSRRM